MRYPKWIIEKAKENKKEFNFSDNSILIRKDIKEYTTNTICYEALCPNKGECFKNKHATFLILGTICTRNCKFCNVSKGKPDPVDLNEPKKIAGLIKKWKIRYAVFTSPTRDDLPDGGADQFANTIKEIRRISPETYIEPLIPDFKFKDDSLKKVLDAMPSVLSHNIETVKRLYPIIRPNSSYEGSLNLLRSSKKINPKIPTKSSIIIGMGEEIEEIKQTIKDLKDNNCDIIVIGQYLSPSPLHHPVKKYYTPEEFEILGEYARQIGIKSVISMPFARSSYKAEEAYLKWLKK
ncbi:MAG: lipoyl synthase [Elusimicrobiota bacterium]